MKFTYLFSVLAALLFAFTSCQDDDTATQDVRPLLVNRTWELTGLTANAENGESIDYYAALDACDRDDVWRYVENGYYELNEGIEKCTDDDPQVYETGTWDLVDNQLTMRKSGETRTYTVLGVTNSALNLQSTKVVDNRNIIFNYTFTR